MSKRVKKLQQFFEENEFSVDDEIYIHRQDKRYCKDFTVRQSVEDFEHFYNHLQEIADKLI